MKYFSFYLLVFLLPLFSTLRAQDAVATTEQLIADIFEQYTAESGDDVDYNSFYEDLISCSQNPVNLNLATREQLEKLPFLNDSQIENILSYIYRFGPLKTIYELQLIEGLDMTDIRRMIPFVLVDGNIQPVKKIYGRDLLRYGKNELYFRMDKGLKPKAGYDAANTNGYSGNELYNSIKYRYHYKDRIQAGFTAEKDAGEQFWGTNRKGYDFYSMSAQLNDFGKFKTIVAGDFRASFGQGLVLRTEFGTGKSSYVLNVAPRSSGLKKYSSTDESNFFRGAGATARFGNVSISAFYSNKQIDGDTANHVFTSVYKTGLHRTLSEMDKKHTVNQQVAGGNFTLTISNVQIGLTAVHTLLDSRLEPEKSVYNSFYFSGNRQTTAGIHYKARWHKLNLFGETAMEQNGAVATVNGVLLSPISIVNLVALHRYFSPEYDTFYANAFSESSRVSNESGFYLGAEVRPIKGWKLAAYADNYQSHWPKYGVYSPSDGMDYLLQLDYSAARNVSMFWRFRYEDKPQNASASDAVMPEIVPARRSSLRYNLLYSFGNFSFKNVVEGNVFREGYAARTYGINASQDVSCKLGKMPLKLDFRLQVFDAVNYENRFYSYEKDVLYAFSIPMFYGLGSRAYLNLRYDLNPHFSVWFKAAQTIYADDRESVGSGNEESAGNRKTDLRLLLKWDF